MSGGFKITQPKTNYVGLVSNSSSSGGSTGIGGTPICSTAPSTGQILTFNGTEWCGVAPAATTVTVDEIDGSPSVAATEIKVPNGSLSVVGTVATLAFSPMTTKGDLYGYSTLNARIPIGTDGTRLRADSTQALGLAWSALIWTPMTVFDPTTGNWLPLVDGSGNQIMAEV